MGDLLRRIHSKDGWQFHGCGQITKLWFRSVQTQPSENNNSSDTVRSLVSLALVLHLFICLTCLASNYRASLVQVGLLNFTRYYSLAFNLDLPNTRFQLTHAEPTDDDHVVELLVVTADAPEGRWEPLPSFGWRCGERYQRFQRLAKTFAYFARSDTDDDLEAVYASAICRHAQQSLGKDVREIRCVNLVPLNRDEVAGNPLTYNSRNVIYHAGVVSVGDDVNVSKIEASAESAEVKQ